MHFLILLAFCASTFGATSNVKRGNYGSKSDDQGSSWGEWVSSTSSTTPGSTCSVVTIISTIKSPCPPITTLTTTIETTTTVPGINTTITSTTTLPGGPTVTITNTTEVDSTKTIDSTTTVDSTITIPGATVTSTTTTTTTTTTTVSGSGVCCGGNTTVVNNYYGNKTVTSTSTYTKTVTKTVPAYCPPTPSCSPNGTIDSNALLIALKAYFDTTFIEELNATLVESLEISLFKSLNESLSISLNESISNDFMEVVSVETEKTIQNVIENEFVDFSKTFVSFEENITSTINTSIEQTISKTFNQDIITNINATIYGAFRNNTYNTNITLNQTSLHYMNKSITDVVFGYIHNQFSDRTSSFYSDMSQITQAYAYNTSPWYAIAILTLLLIFGILTLAGLLWLILKGHKHRKRIGNCPDCGAPQDQCACGT